MSKKKTDCPSLANMRGRPCVVLCIQKSLNLEHVYRLRHLLAEKKYPALDVVIHSGGGEINSAFKIVELLRLHADKVYACVPIAAKSAATLICLGCDVICIDELGELGPLDTQILEEKKGGKADFASALNPFKTLEQLQKFSLETFDTGVKMVMTRSGMGLDECIKHSIEFVGVTTGPLFSKLDPEKLGEYSRALAVGKEYAERIVRRYKKWEPQKTLDLVEKLVHGYPSHDYIIDYHELREIGLDVEMLSAQEMEACNAFIRTMVKEGDQISFCEPTPPESAKAEADEQKLEEKPDA